MPASHDTIDKVIEVLRKHVDKETLGKIAADLLNVPGNSSFRVSIQRLYEVTTGKKVDAEPDTRKKPGGK